MDNQEKGDIGGLALVIGYCTHHGCRRNLPGMIGNHTGCKYRILRGDMGVVVLQAGGWSANAQPVDQVHNLLRARLDLCDSSDLGCQPDLRSRTRFLAKLKNVLASMYVNV